MHFVSMSKLKEKLKNGELTEKDVFLYLLFGSIGSQVIFAFYSYFASADILWIITSIMGLAIVAAGAYLTYLANGGRSGKDLALRSISIMFVAWFQVTLISLFIFACIYIAPHYITGYKTLRALYYTYCIFSVFILIFYYYIIVKAMNEVARFCGRAQSNTPS